MTTFRFGAKALSPSPLPAPRVMPSTSESERVVRESIRVAAAGSAMVEETIEKIESMPQAEYVSAPDGTTQEHVPDSVKLTKLIDDDFPFDESQLAAIFGMLDQRFACLTGAAGTGKTTSIKKFVQELHESSSLGSVDMESYFKKNAEEERVGVDADDEYEITEKWVPSICLVGFTGRSSQMIKKNFPRDWHGNIMTIHRMLAFAPVFFETWNEESQLMRNKMRFEPQYDANNKLPWDVIIIDEAGMVSIDLWNQLWAACKPGTRIYMIGDINQLPPVHGRSIFGFAMSDWPSWELTHIHRQEGVNNSIVDNAWRILKGLQPISDSPADPTWKFVMMEIPEDSNLASQKIRAWLAKMNGKAYVPNRDSVITAINGQDDSKGYALGQIPMNRELAMVFNKENPRFIIDAGRERKQFAVGDKVMATRNDHEVGITNGMTGIITSIARHGGYVGEIYRFGEVSEVAKYLADEDIGDDEEEDFTLEELKDSMDSISEEQKKAKDAKERGPASHIVTVRFGEGEHAFEIAFGSLAEVASLMTAYVVTCHKMQGGESPLVVVICHQAHRQMLNREWLYTAVTRASKKCVVFYTKQGMRIALNKQRITGTTLKDKIKVFQELMFKGPLGAAVKVDIPKPESFGTSIVPAKPQGIVERSEAQPLQTSAPESILSRLRTKRDQEKIQPSIHLHLHKHETHVHVNTRPEQPAQPPIKNGGDAVRVEIKERTNKLAEQLMASMTKAIAPPKPTWPVAVSPVVTHHQAKRPEPLLLTHQPPAKPEPVTPRPARFGGVRK